MSFNTFKPTYATGETRKTFLVRNFVGIDLSTDRNSVASQRAIASTNYLYKDGCVQKRNGYEEIAKYSGEWNLLKVSFDGTKTLSPIEKLNVINSVWKFVGEDGNSHIVAHIGHSLFEVSDFDTGRPTFSPILFDKSTSSVNGVVYHYAFEFPSFRSMKSFFVGKKMLWFVNGSKFVVIRALSNGLVIQPVEDNADLTFIPTTMVSITYTNSIVSGRSALDDPNMLTEWRKDKLLSGTGKGDVTSETQTQFFEYPLSTTISPKSGDADMAKIRLTIQERGTK